MMTKNFEELLEEYEIKNPRRGQIVEGEVIAMTDDAVILDVGAKRDAIVPKQEMDQLAETTLQELSIGNQLPVYITRTTGQDDELLVSIEKGLAQQDWLRASQAFESEEMLELEVVDTNAGGLLVAFGRINGFVPNSMIPGLPHGLRKPEKQAAKNNFLGKTLHLKTIEVNQSRKRFILSGKAAEAERRKERLQELQVGEKVTGVVSNVVDFGAFVDLDGVDGLVHISKLSWEKTDHPSDVVQPGEEIEVLVEKVDIERERVSLDRRALLPSPWDAFAEQFHSGDIIEGTVEAVRSFGAFITLTDKITGLVHTSEMLPGSTHDPTETIRAGEKALVRIIEIDPKRQRVRLSMRRVPMDDFTQWMLDNQDYAITSPEDEEETLAAEEGAEQLPEPLSGVDEFVLPDEELLKSEPKVEDSE